MSGAEGRQVCRDVDNQQVKTKIIDMDILFYGEDPVKTSRLIVPHPHLERRAYALVPLLEIAPDLLHPVLRKTVTQIHEELNAPEQVVLYGTREKCDFM